MREDVLFHNRFVQTKALLLEFASKIYRKGQRAFAYVYGAFALVVGVMLLYQGAELLLGIILLLCACLGFFGPSLTIRQNVQRSYARAQVLCQGKPMYMDLYFGCDTIQTADTSGAVRQFTYDQVMRVCETEHLYILMLPQRIGLLLAKDGFLKGSGADFIPFLRTKCSRCKSFG